MMFGTGGVRSVRQTASAVLVAMGVAPMLMAVILVVVGAPEPAVGEWLVATLDVVAVLMVAGGLIAAVRWRAHVIDQPMPPRRYLSGTIVRAAIAESGLIVAMVGFLFSGTVTVLATTVAGYVLALVILSTTINRADLADSGR